MVVGPNGSGKSNISDAIVWAAGSLSPSELRAEKPEDVLYVGSKDKPAADWCEVELLFDNEAGDGPLDVAELSIVRRLHRGGEGREVLGGSRDLGDRHRSRCRCLGHRLAGRCRLDAR